MEVQTLWKPEQTTYRRPTMAEVERVPANGLRAAGSFSGCGGSSLGLRMAGFSVGYAIEFVEAAADTYQANAPGAHVDRRDIRQIEPEQILETMGLEAGELDLFEGSPPCASFSAAGSGSKHWGQEKAYSDTRQRTDDLFWEWARLLADLAPRAFVAENVPGMINGLAREEYAHRIIRDLSSLGYRVNARVLNSCHYGTPQLRERLIFLGLRNDVAGAAGVDLPEHPPPTTPEPITLRQALEDVPALDPDHVRESSMEPYAVGRTWREMVRAREEDRETDFTRLPCQRCGEELFRHPEYETSSSGAIIKARCADGGKAEILKDYFMLVVPRLGEPCPTVTATGAQPGAASVTHPTECRKMTPEELLSVCGFPADFILTGTREQRCERMGRAVTPPLYAAVGRRITEYLEAADVA